MKTVSLPADSALPAAHAGGAVTTSARATWAARWIGMLVLVYAASALFTVHQIIDPDIWWHLRTGQWVIEHRAVPVTDPFSTYGAGHPWVAYSWLFGVAVYALHAALGNVGIVLYSLIGGLAATTALLILVARSESRIPYVLGLTAVALGAIGPLLAPRAYAFTIVFFIVEVYVLFAARETGRTRLLWLLPPLFALWANVHVQFVHGLLVLGLAVVESAVVLVWRRDDRIARASVPLRPMLLATLACTLATFVTPYGVGLYRAVIEHSGQRRIYYLITELAAPSFRAPSDWIFLALVLAAAFSLGRQRRLQVFPTLSFAAGAYFSFLSVRDVWFLIVVCTAIIAMTWGSRRLPHPRFSWTTGFVTAVGVAIVVSGIAAARHVSDAALEASLATNFPVRAAAMVHEHRYEGPLYNDFNWGGFLIWRLPEYRVAMDGRANLHGDERIRRSVETWSGRDWESDEELRSARLVIAPSKNMLTRFLRRDPGYRVVYEDAVAVVFTRNDAPNVTVNDHRRALDAKD